MPSEPAVTVIVRNYNRGDRLLRACRSIFAQDFQDFELLLVDDASSDGSAQAAQAAFGADPRFRLLCLPENRTAGGAAAVGIEEARAPLCAFLDSDDEWLPGTLGAFVLAAEEEPDRLLFYGDVIFRYEALDLEGLNISDEPPDQRGGMLRGGFIQTLSSVAVRREAILSVGNYEARWRVPHDMHCHAKLALAYDRPFRRIRQPLVRYNVATDNVMQAYQTWSTEYQQIMRELHQHPNAQLYRDDLEMTLAKGVVGQYARQKNDLAVAEGAYRKLTAVVFVREGGSAVQATLDSVQAQTAPADEILMVALGPRRPHLRAEGGGRWFSAEQRLDRRRTLVSIAKQIDSPLIAVLEEGDVWEPGYLEAQRRAHALISNLPIFSFADDDTLEDVDIFELSSEIKSCWSARPFPKSYSAMAVSRKKLLKLPEHAQPSLGDEAQVTARLLLDQCESGGFAPIRVRRPLVRMAAMAG